MKNRLQFRYHSDVFFNRDMAYEYLTETINNKYDERSFSSLIAEPLVAYYSDANGDTQVLFLIGVNGNGSQPADENTKYFILDGAKINEDIDELKKNQELDHNRIVALEKALQEEIERAKKKEQELEQSINKLIRNLEAETAARKAVDGQEGPKYIANQGTTADPVYYITGATSLNHADIILDKSLNMIEKKALVNINVNGIEGVVEDNISNVIIGGKDIVLTDYTMGTNSHPVTKTDTVNSAFGKLQVQIDSTQKGAGLNEDCTYNQNVSATYIKDAKSIHNATEILDETISNLYGGEPFEGMETIHKIGVALKKETSQRVEADEKLSVNVEKNKNDIIAINNYSVNNKLIKNNPIINGGDIPLDNYIASAGVSNIVPSDTVNIALGKLETRTKSTQTNLDNEINRAIESENVLTNNVNTLSSTTISIQNDLNIAEENITTLTNALNNETNRAINAETVLSDRITTNENDIDTIENNLSSLSTVVNQNKIVNKDGSVTLTPSNGNTDLKVRIAENANALKLTVDGLFVDDSALTSYNGENAIVISQRDTNNSKKVSLKINNNDKVLVNDGAGLRTDISMVYEKENQRIRLYGKSIDGVSVIVSEINVADFIADGMIDDVKYDKETKILTITWNSTSGLKPVEIDFKGLIDVYTAGNGLRLDENSKFHVVVNETGCDQINGVSVLVSDENGIKVVGISNAIDSEIERAKASEVVLQNNLEVVSNSTKANEELIRIESERAKGSEKTLQNNIDTEKVARENADNILTTDVNVIKSDITELKSNVNTNKDNLTSEITRAKESETTLQNNIDAEKVARENADNILTTDVNVIKSDITKLDAQVDKNAKDIVNTSNNATQSAITLNNLISENKSAIDLLNADYTVGGSVKHTITDSLIAKQASPSANEANDQTLLRQVAGTNTFYASNSTKDMMHGEYVLSTVIEDIKNTTNSTQQEVSELKEKVATLETQMVDAQFRIETLETELSELKNNFEQQVKNIISKTIIGVDKETMVTNVYAPNAEGVEVINQIKIGFDTDAIFNATNN